MRDLREDLKVIEAATEGPWSNKYSYVDAGVNDGSHKGWKAPVDIPKGKCWFCNSRNENKLIKTYKEDKGNYHRHRLNRNPDEWQYITSERGASITGNYDYEEGGVCSKPEDSAFICAARTGWPIAIHRAMAAEARVRELEEAINNMLSCPASKDDDGHFRIPEENVKELKEVYRKGLKPDGATD